MPQYTVFFVGGPSHGNILTRTWDKPPVYVLSHGERYNLNLNDSEGSILVYAFAGSRYDDTDAATIRGKRDVFKAFRRLMHVATHNVGGEMKRIAGARNRIKRAVR